LPYLSFKQSLMNSPGPSPYDPFVLSEAEKTRFRAALGDGFFYQNHRSELIELPVPDGVDAGLLQHPAFLPRSREGGYCPSDQNEESPPLDDPFPGMTDGEPEEYPWIVEEPDEERWPVADEAAEGQIKDPDEPWADFWMDGLYMECPVNFDLAQIRRYFEEQKAAYLAYAKSLDGYTPPDDIPQNERDEHIYSRVLFEHYTKAWYEFHINKAISFATYQRPTLHEEDKTGERLRSALDFTIKYAAIAGRLIEQYYWKCNFEQKAISGTKLSQAGKDGAAQSAAKHKAEHARWQAVADLIWKEYPSKLKTPVALAVKKRLHLGQTVGQIKRVLKRPKKLRKQP
jgi:hypothetical protein